MENWGFRQEFMKKMMLKKIFCDMIFTIAMSRAGIYLSMHKGYLYPFVH